MATKANSTHRFWDDLSWRVRPRVWPAYEMTADGCEGLFYESATWNDRLTRVFAWFGRPKTLRGAKVPGIVLVHGGGGTAFPEWVRLWTSRGFAALAMDTCGNVSGGEHGKRPRHPHAGPPGNNFNEAGLPASSQWPFHAVAAVLAGHSLLASMDDVDADRIGMTGVSWGAIISILAAAMDDRVRFLIPIYGCGFLDGDAKLLPTDRQATPQDVIDRWQNLWDPSHYVASVRCPSLWMNGTNDTHFPMNSFQNTYNQAVGPVTRSIRIDMPHAHGGPSETPIEIGAFASSVVLNGTPLARVGMPEVIAGGMIELTAESEVPIVSAELNITQDVGPWSDRKWVAFPACVKAAAVTAPLPAGATACFINICDARGLVVSSPYREF